MLHDSSCLLSLRIDRKEYQIERPGCPPTDTRNLSHLSRANRSERLCCNCCQPFPDSKSPCAKQWNSTCQGRVNLRILHSGPLTLSARRRSCGKNTLSRNPSWMWSVCPLAVGSFA